MTTTLELLNVTLRVPNLARSLDFYAGRLGFVALARSSQAAELGVSHDAAPILNLMEDSRAAPASAAQAGLFHAALLFSNRANLGAWLRDAARRGLDFDGFSDHGVSEAIYFSDPDGNGLEFYADRPRTDWPFSGQQVAMVTHPLDISSVLEAGTAIQPNGTPLSHTRWGHLHLRVTELARSERFYRQSLGAVVTQGDIPGARFLAADGYHHHLGLNIWGTPREPQPAGALGLASVTFASASTTTIRDIRDPDGIEIRIAPK